MTEQPTTVGEIDSETERLRGEKRGVMAALRACDGRGGDGPGRLLERPRAGSSRRSSPSSGRWRARGVEVRTRVVASAESASAVLVSLGDERIVGHLVERALATRRCGADSTSTARPRV